MLQQLGVAAAQPREILLHDCEHIVLAAAGLACGMGRDEHVLHRPQRRGGGQRLLDRAAAAAQCCLEALAKSTRAIDSGFVERTAFQLGS